LYQKVFPTISLTAWIDVVSLRRCRKTHPFCDAGTIRILVIFDAWFLIVTLPAALDDFFPALPAAMGEKMHLSL
jgi:hypothetical protein